MQAAGAAVGLVAVAAIGSVIFVVSQGTFAPDVPEVANEAPPRTDCPKAEVDAYFRDCEPIIREFVDATDRASVVPRSALGDVLRDLQSVRRRYAAVKRPPCTEEFHRHVDAGMGHVVEAVMTVMSNPNVTVDPAPAMQAQFEAAKRAKDAIRPH